ncbi:DUF1127 domain-containing protein [Roseobacter denitrificans]|uniref:YjiS-like domain-containing protein n=1 Tax=Roseobacter denitrificans (strain ATCC 33942 / OCh 114) TaxID=375451 RepID=Q163H7_ROSDO|nr:DUF1127 domain-containing protein [Roseobacter denitrificans]ABG32866.1 conserved hypothetical protein [Roseobacter denitrificans OCh 114]AVL52264.1 DUF1127 domain-containing protein [Roseobacter denitrificans]SFF95929.1 protein of unknown function [Roseobacter denitrificans OCh 114]
MTYYNHIKSPSAFERLLAWGAHGLQQAAVAHARYRIYRSSLSELRALSDRELEDLGMSRYVLKDIAMQTAIEQTARVS